MSKNSRIIRVASISLVKANQLRDMGYTVVLIDERTPPSPYAKYKYERLRKPTVEKEKKQAHHIDACHKNHAIEN